MWNSGILLVAMAVISAVIVGTNAGRASKIMGGRPASLHESTFVVRVANHGTCTGAIIGPRHILTAAHCLNADSGYVYSGMTNRSDPNLIVSNIKRVFKHPKEAEVFNSLNGIYDIGVVELENDLDLRSGRLHAVRLPTAPLDVASVGTVFGWGPCQVRHFTLQRALVSFLPWTRCNGDSPDLTRKFVCMSVEPAKICSGDSGGPVVSGGNVVAVVIAESLATYVYGHLQWIRSIVNPSSG